MDFFSKIFTPKDPDEKIKSELNSEKPIKLKKQNIEINDKKENFVEKTIPFEITEITEEPNVSNERRDSVNTFKNNSNDIVKNLENEEYFNQEDPKKNIIQVEPKQELAVLNIKPKELKKELREPVNNFVGLLLPLTGEKRVQQVNWFWIRLDTVWQQTLKI